MKKTIFPLPDEFENWLPEIFYQEMKDLENDPDNRNNPALLCWAKVNVLNKVVEQRDNKARQAL